MNIIYHPSFKRDIDKVNHRNLLLSLREKIHQIEVAPSHAHVTGLKLLTTIPYFLKAYALLHRGRFEDAHKAATKAVEQDSNSFMAQRALGLSYLGMEKYDLAIDALLIAARLSNRHHWLLFELMGAYVLSGKQEDAIAIMEEAMAVSNLLPSRIYDSLFPVSL